jgi:hypothetical protein
MDFQEMIMNTSKRRPSGPLTTFAGAALLLVLFLLQPVAVRAQWTTPDANQNISNTNSGNVGVKTTTPEFPLQVNSSSSNVLGLVYTGTLSSSSGAGIQSLTSATPSAADHRLGFYTFGVRNGGTSYNPIAIQGFSSQSWTLNSAQGGYLTFSTTPNGSITRTERMRIDQNGYVGIGTTGPWYPLSVVAPGGARAGIGLAGGGDAYGYIDFTLTPLGTMAAGKPIDFTWALRKDAFFGGDSSGASMIMVMNRQGGGWYVPLVLNPNGNVILAGANNATNGNVGVGLLNPAYKLDVSGSVNSSGGLCIAGDCKTAWSQVGGSQWSNAAPSIFFNTGNVGIGTSSPSQKLEVNGGALIGTIYGSSAASGVLTLQSTSSTTKGTINIGVDQTTTTNIGQSGTTGNKLIVATDRLIVNNSSVRINGAADHGDLSVTKVNITNADALQFRTTNPSIVSNGSMLFTVNNVNSDNVRFSVQNSSISNAFVIDSNTATPAKLLDVRDLGASKFTVSGAGNVSATGTVNASGGLCISGDCKTSWSQVGGPSQWNSGASSAISYSAGNVGIGTTTPAKALDVVGDFNASGTITGGTIQAKYQDVAEWVESSQELPAGTVVVLDTTKSNQVIASARSYDSRVAGVISLRPGLTLGEQSEGRVLVATTGRVKVRVDASKGPINIGDLLVTSDKEGFAMKSVPVELGGVQIHRPGTLIGKALEPLAKGTGEILVLLSLQ